MSLLHIPARGSKNSEYIHVPLVVYIGAERHVVGEAVINGTHVEMTLGEDIGREFMDQLIGRPDEAQFSLGFTAGPNPFRKIDPLAAPMLYSMDEMEMFFKPPLPPEQEGLKRG